MYGISDLSLINLLILLLNNYYTIFKIHHGLVLSIMIRKARLPLIIKNKVILEKSKY